MDKMAITFPGLGWEFNISPVAFRLGSLEIYWYGIIIAFAMILCVILAISHAKKNDFSSELVYDIAIVSLPSAIVGARLYYVLCEWETYSADLSRIFDTRSGGLAVYGGVIGAFLGAFIMLRIRKIPYSTCADYCIPYIPLGQAIGRWGNFFNQEAFGTTTSLPWGMKSERTVSYLSSNCPNLDSAMPVHPTFLYESLVNFALFFVLLKVRKKSRYSYETLSLYMIVYGITRFFLEGIRTDSLYLGNTGIRTSQLLSLILVVAGFLLIAYSHITDFRRVPLPERLMNTAEVSAETSEDASGEASVPEDSTLSEEVEAADEVEVPGDAGAGEDTSSPDQDTGEAVTEEKGDGGQ